MPIQTSVDIFVPVYNEALQLEENIVRLYHYIGSQSFSVNWDWKICIVDNGSTDLTEEIGVSIERRFRGIQYLRLEERKGVSKGVSS